MADKLENLSDEQSGRGGDGLGDGDGNGSGIDGGVSAGSGPVAGGDGASIGGSRGSDGDGGDGGSDSGASEGVSLGDSGSDIGAPVGDIVAPVGSDEPVRRKRGRPRNSGSRGSGDSNNNSGRTGTDSDGEKSVAADHIRVKQGEPKNVKADTILDAVSSLPKGSVEAIIAAVLQGIFFIPANTLGDPLGKVWTLSDREAKELAKAVIECLDTLPKKQRQNVDKLLKEWGPWIKLATVGGAIMLPRVEATREIWKLKKENERLSRNNANPGNVTDPAGNVEWPSTIDGGPDPNRQYGFGSA